MTSNREQELEQLRQTAFKKSIKEGQEQRLGLYSYAPYSIGENTYTHKITIKKGEDGLVLTQPPNICSGPLKTGQIQSSFFSKLASVNIGDPYLSEYQRDKVLDARNAKIVKSTSTNNKEPFIGGIMQKKVKAQYKHMQDYTYVVKKKDIDESGQVRTGPKNITVMLPKSGHWNTTNDHTFMKAAPWKSEPYNRAQKMELAKRARVRKRVSKVHEKAFMGSGKKSQLFFSDIKTYGNKSVKIPKKQSWIVGKYNGKFTKPHKHEGPFRYPCNGRLGPYATIGKLPRYMTDPIHHVKKRKWSQTPKAAFKQGYKPSWFPSPSIFNGKQNLRKILSTRRR